MNGIAAYMLHALAKSQSMGKLLYAFKNVRNMEQFLEENADPSGGSQPLLTCETMAYAISLFVGCVCLHSNDKILKSRASAAYARKEARAAAAAAAAAANDGGGDADADAEAEAAAEAEADADAEDAALGQNGEGEAAQPAAAKASGGARKTKPPAAAAVPVPGRRGSRAQK